MKVSSMTLLLVATIGSSAHPGHHGHRHFHRAADNAAAVKFDKATRPTSDPGASVKNYASTPSQSPSDASPSTDYNSGFGSSSGSGNSVITTKYKEFCGGQLYKRVTAAQIAAKGNLGTPSDYGCNLLLIGNHLVPKYDYTLTIKNEASTSLQCACWLKIGRDGGVNGSFKDQEVFKFPVNSSSQQSVAIAPDSKGTCSCGFKDLETTTYGQYAGTWAEYDMGSRDNKNCSGADASVLVAQSQGLSTPALKLCDKKQPQLDCSVFDSKGITRNAYVLGMEAVDGVGLNIPPGNVRLSAIYH